MNESESMPVVPPLINHPANEQPFRDLLKRLLGSNPFYPISAVCLLYGLYRLTIDPAIRNAELGQLGAIFGSLQLYEILLVITAIFLAQRRVWYDSTLLVSLENLLVFVPFILVTVAAFFRDTVIWTICGTGALLAVARFWGLKQFIRELNLPARLLVIGAMVLAANLAVPFLFRETQKVDAAPLASYSRYGWLIALPVLFGLTNLLRRPTHWGGVTAQRSWLPLGFAATWITASAVHLYCLGYIYDLDWRPAFLAPLLWMASWTLYNRHTDFADALPNGWRTETQILPAVVVLLGAWGGTSQIVLTLATINAVIYAGLYLRQSHNRFALHLLLISLTTMAAAMPESWASQLFKEDARPYCVLGAIWIYLIGNSIFSRHPIWGLAGSAAIFVAILNRMNGNESVGSIAWQATAAYLLIHSLRWQREPQADAVRLCVAIGWLVAAAFWVFGDEPTHSWVTAASAGVVLAGYGLTWLITRRWSSLIIPISAGIVFLLLPAQWIAISATAGLLSVLLAFALFGAGTLLAVTKEKWSLPANRQ